MTFEIDAPWNPYTLILNSCPTQGLVEESDAMKPLHWKSVNSKDVDPPRLTHHDRGVWNEMNEVSLRWALLINTSGYVSNADVASAGESVHRIYSILQFHKIFHLKDGLLVLNESPIVFSCQNIHSTLAKYESLQYNLYARYPIHLLL